jgi:hydrogenase maturation protease
MGDEGIGVYVVRALEKHTLPAGVECLDGGTGGFTLLEPLKQADRIILIDAAADGNPIGTVTRTTPRFSRDYPPTLTAHDVGMKDLLDMFYIQGGQHEIVLYAITIDPHQPIRMSLSAEGEISAAEAVERILAELRAGADGQGSLVRFHNLRALSGIVKGGFFLRKKPLYGTGARVQQLWNRCSAAFYRNDSDARWN